MIAVLNVYKKYVTRNLSTYITWATANILSVKPQRTCLMTFTNIAVTVPPIKMKDTYLEGMLEGKFLRLKIPNKIEFDSHISLISKKISKSFEIFY